MSQCSVALLLYIVDHLRSCMCRFVCNARLCGGITSVGFFVCLAEYLTLSCGSFGIVMASQPSWSSLGSSRRLSSCMLCGLSVCWPPKRQCSISTTSSPQHGSTSCLPGNFFARLTISTIVDDTSSSHRASVSHNIHNRLESLDCV